MSYLRIYLLLIIFDLTFSESICEFPQNSCECILPNKTIIDLSSVGLPDKPRFFDVLFDSNCSEVFSYNPCFPFDSPEKYISTDPAHISCTGASACVRSFGKTDGSPPEEHAIGLQNTAIFGSNKDQIYINYTVPSSKKTLQVILKCVNESAEVHELTMDGFMCSNFTDLIVLTLSSICACPDGCLKGSPKESSPGLSPGSKLLIAFFTILLAYLIIGVVWNYCNGSQGMELIPNIEFWNDLPTLIMEGVVFTCSCCGRQSSYGEV